MVRGALPVLLTLALVGCGDDHRVAQATTPNSVVVNGRTYVTVGFGQVRLANTSTLDINGLPFVAPMPIRNYPRKSLIVEGPYPSQQPYIWTGTKLVLLVPRCALLPPGMMGRC
jgi:hypothetical protein